MFDALVTCVRVGRQALRSVARHPGFSLAAIVTLGVGIGATSAIATLIYSLLFRPLPGVTAPRLLALQSTFADAPDDDPALSFTELEALRGSAAFTGVEGVIDRNLTLTGGTEPERIAGSSVTPGLLSLLGVEPLLGRRFRADEGRTFGAEEVALLGYGLWQRRFGGDPAIVGRSVHVNQRPLTVIGVLPAGFGLPETQQLYVPFTPRTAEERGWRMFWTVAQLAPGSDLDGAAATARGIVARVAREAGESRRRTLTVEPLRRAMVDHEERRLFLALALAVAALLGIACANVASLLLARGADRAGELALRAALGAGRGRLVASQLLETLVLALGGGLLGVVLGRLVLVSALAALADELPVWFSLAFDARLFAILGGLCLATTLLAGLAPAFLAARGALASQMAGVTRRNVGGGARLRRGLVVAEFALALTLTVAASWSVQAFVAVTGANLGFDERPLLSLRFYLPGDRYDPPAARQAFFTAATERLAALPGVAGAAAVSSIPGDDGGADESLFVAGGDQPGAGGSGAGAPTETGLPVSVIGTAGDLFSTLGLPLASGRGFTPAEQAATTGPGAVLLGRRLADRLFPGGAAIGRRVRLGAAPDAPWHTVVGVVPDLVYEEPGEETPRSRLQLYVPYARLGWRTMAFFVRAAGDPAALAQPVRAAFAALEPDAPLFDLATMRERHRQVASGQQVISALFALFALQALLLAAVGVYSVLAYSVSRRTPEIGLRMALGADAARVLRQVAGEGLLLSGFGAALGLALSGLAARAARAIFWGVDTGRPALIGAALAVLVAVAVTACLLPARRAARLDPAAALRSE